MSRLARLKAGTRARPGRHPGSSQAAVDDLFNRPNIDVAADVNTVSPLFNANLVETGPVFRKGYWSQVTAGPKTGFGLLPSDDGIAFYNKQTLVSVTPITDFQNQIAADPQGQRAAKLYQFGATSYDWSELTITTVLRPSGLTITPSSTHNIDAAIGASPTEGGGLGTRNRRLDRPEQRRHHARKSRKAHCPGSSSRFRPRPRRKHSSGSPSRPPNAMPTCKPRAWWAMTRWPSTMFSSSTSPCGRGRMAFSWEASSSGAAHPGSSVPTRPQPPNLAATFEPGVTADVHLSSLLTSAAAGLYQRDEVQLGSKPDDHHQGRAARHHRRPTRSRSRKNVDFPTYIKAVDESRKPGSRANVLRLTRPPQPPEFSVDAKGNLVAIVHDLQIEVPAPESEAKGGVVGAAAKIYRIKIPQAEIALSYKVETAPGNPPQLHAKVEDFNPGTNSEVLAITDDETKAVPLSRFSASLVLGGIGGRLRSSAHQCLARPAQSAGLLDPLGLAARPQRLGSGWARAQPQCPTNCPDRPGDSEPAGRRRSAGRRSAGCHWSDDSGRAAVDRSMSGSPADHERPATFIRPVADANSPCDGMAFRPTIARP